MIILLRSQAGSSFQLLAHGFFAIGTITFHPMSENGSLPPTLEKVLRQFRLLDRDAKMQALLAWSKRLEPLPEAYAALDREAFSVPECQTRVDIFPEWRADGTMHFFADVNARQSPTVAAFLAITFSAINDQPPDVTLSLPSDFVRQLMSDIGLGARESGLTAMIDRLKRHAAAPAGLAALHRIDATEH